MSFKILCLTVDHNQRPLGDFFRVVVGEGAEISVLKKKVKEEKPFTLEGVDHDELIVWRCTDRSIALDPEKLQDQLGEVFERRQTERLDGWQEIAQLQILEEESLIVQVPGTSRTERPNPLFISSLS
jgi:hypothetical protein